MLRRFTVKVFPWDVCEVVSSGLQLLLMLLLHASCRWMECSWMLLCHRQSLARYQRLLSAVSSASRRSLPETQGRDTRSDIVSVVIQSPQDGWKWRERYKHSARLRDRSYDTIRYDRFLSMCIYVYRLVFCVCVVVRFMDIRVCYCITML